MAAGVALLTMFTLPPRLWQSQVCPRAVTSTQRSEKQLAHGPTTAADGVVSRGPSLQRRKGRASITQGPSSPCASLQWGVTLRALHAAPRVQLSRLGLLCAFIFVMTALGADGVPPVLQVGGFGRHQGIPYAHFARSGVAPQRLNRCARPCV